MLKLHKPTQRNNQVAFLPVGYQAPKSSGNYMKLQDGENKIRILSQPVLGWEDWVDQKPVRYRMDEKPSSSHDPKKPLRHFWAMIVWNYRDEQIQILQITQASIRSAIETLCNDADWGAPYFYDLKIVKSGQKMDTEYVVNPLPHKPVAPHIEVEFYAKPINLDALFVGEDPFAGIGKHTEGVFGDQQKETITEQQVLDLQSVLMSCDQQYRERTYDVLRNTFGISELSEMTPDVYERVYTAAKKKAEELKQDSETLFN